MEEIHATCKSNLFAFAILSEGGVIYIDFPNKTSGYFDTMQCY